MEASLILKSWRLQGNEPFFDMKDFGLSYVKMFAIIILSLTDKIWLPEVIRRQIRIILLIRLQIFVHLFVNHEIN